MKSVEARLSTLESIPKTVSEHEARIMVLESNMEDIKNSIQKNTELTEKGFQQLTDKFASELDTARARIDSGLDEAMTTLKAADERWASITTQIINTMASSGQQIENRITKLEREPADQALEEKKAAKKALATKAFDIIWKVLVAGIVALLAAKGINLF